jgi:hypothetical protein
MPRRKTDPVVFDFQINPEKTLSERTLADYKKRLDKITALSVEKNKENKKNPIIKNKDDLLAHSDYVVSLIKQMSDKRLALCAFYSSVFYSTGRQDYESDARGKIYYEEFRQVYYTESYKKPEEE